MRKSKKKLLTETIQKEVIQDENYQRMLKETAEKMELPLDVVEAVMNDFVLQLPKFIYPLKKSIRISVFGFFNINVKVYQKKELNN